MDYYFLLPSPDSNGCECATTTAAKLASQRPGIIPLLLLGIVALLSLSYRFSRTLELSKPTRKTVIAIHAFATEGVQLLLAVNALINTALLFLAISRASSPSCENKASKTTLNAAIVAFGTLAGNIFAVYAVDLIEGWIVSRKLVHPYQWRCLIITRALLFTPKTHTAVRVTRRRARTLSEPTPTDVRTLPSGICTYRRRMEMLPDLAYLDLAYLDFARSGYRHERFRHTRASTTSFMLSRSPRSSKPCLVRRNTI